MTTEITTGLIILLVIIIVGLLICIAVFYDTARKYYYEAKFERERNCLIIALTKKLTEELQNTNNQTEK